MSGLPDYGIAPRTLARLRSVLDRTPGVERVWIYGSRARGDHRDNSDIDLCVDAPEVDSAAFAQLWDAIDRERFLYGIDLTHWQRAADAAFRARIGRDRRVFWEPGRHAADVEAIGAVELKGFQTEVLAQVARLLDELTKYEAPWRQNEGPLRAMKRWNDWQSCLAAAVEQLDALQREAQGLRAETARYIRHRNVAKKQVGLQGWRRHKIYPDFIFAVSKAGGEARTVLIETKGLHLSGADTPYKQALLERLTRAYSDERLARAGELSLSGGTQTEVVCDLVFEGDWRGTLEHRYFTASDLQAEVER